MSATGLVFNIQRFCLHDGPGVRTVLFLKGCPLRCAWCSNPESWEACPELMHDPGQCIGCGRCIAACQHGALTLVPDPDSAAARHRIAVDRQRCVACGACCAVCPSGAMHLAGRWLSVAELLPTLLADRSYYETSGGGVTFSGGEPLAQADFVAAVAEALAAERIDCAIETSGQAQTATLEQVLTHIDHVLFDLKLPDPHGHHQWTGLSNTLILHNLFRAAALRPTILRIPLVPTVNMQAGALDALPDLLAGCAIQAVQLMPYHAWGSGKPAQLGRAAWRTSPADPAENQAIQRYLAERLSVPVLLD